MNNRNEKDSPFYSNPMAVLVWVVGTLLLAILVAVVVIFLSSLAEAGHGNTAKPLTSFDTGTFSSPAATGPRVVTLVWTPTRTPFERVNPPIEFVLEWPRLPSTSEIEVKIAKEKLVEYVSEQAEKAQEKRKAVELQLNWEALTKAYGLALLLVGAFLTFFYGKFKEPPKRRPN